jgi:hypothetical protein
MDNNPFFLLLNFEDKGLDQEACHISRLGNQVDFDTGHFLYLHSTNSMDWVLTLFLYHNLKRQVELGIIFVDDIGLGVVERIDSFY